MSDRAEQKANIKTALKQYLDMGLPIIPLCSYNHAGYSERHIARCSKPGKVPLIKNWQTHEHTTIAQVQTWLREFKEINIGLPLGHISGYVGIDVDGVLGEDMLDELSGGDLPATWEYATGEGRRLLYEIPVGMITKKFVNINDSEEHTECSILAFGQQTVLPPSIHHTGSVYEWVEGRSPEDLDCALAPDWLIDLVRDDGRPTQKRNTPGTIDLTSDNPSYEPEEAVGEKVINPILVTDETIALEFQNFVDVPFDAEVPVASYKGKKSKASKKEDNGVTPEELTKVLSEGGRDVGMTRIVGHFCARYRSLGKEYIMHLAKTHNQSFCSPPLDEISIEAKVNHFWEAEEMKSAQYKDKRGGDDSHEFQSIRIAQVVLNLLEEEGKILKAENSQPIIWMSGKDQGPWRPYYVGGTADEFQLFMVKPLTDPELGGDPKWALRRNYGEVANSLLLMLRQAGRTWDFDVNDIDTQSSSAHKYIPLKGGKLLDWETGELLPWDPETYLTYVIPVEYDPKAQCPNWLMRMEQWLPDKGSRDIIQEFVGYSFIPYMGFERALLIQGEGANGKSMMLETLQKLLGREITTSATMSHLFSRFGKRSLLGKILNIVNEAGADYLKGANADDFKNMVSGGTVVADVKNKEPITFTNTAKFIFSANHDIKTSDKSAAWIRRMILIPFEQDFRNSTETKTEIMDSFAGEYAGIFNWALEGLRRLMANKKFSTSEVVERKMNDYITKNDIAADFFEHCLTIRPELTVDGEAIEKGVATSAVTDLFKLWTSYRGTELKKHGERIKEFLEKKKNIRSARKPNKYLTMTDASKTSCWIHLSIHVTDPDFLEFVLEGEILSLNNVPLKRYLSDRLEEINKEPTPPTPPTPIAQETVAQ